ncbi:hypothetical protein HZA57_02730 [Candidatus Poribacteria bacterium]|nr:hypothetical protein [Candidatus Poribacteria bacterium]
MFQTQHGPGSFVSRFPLSVLVAGGLLCAGTAGAQLNFRPSGSTATAQDQPKDLTGQSLKTRRVRHVHTTDPALEGGSAYFIYSDPFLGFARGRDLTQREFQAPDGVFGRVSLFGGKLTDGFTPKITRDNHTNCGSCHNMPYREAGAGTNFSKSGDNGRNTIHFFGGGLLEMIALQTRQKMLAIADTNQDGWIAKSEMTGQQFDVIPAADAPVVNYGSNTVTGNQPNLNHIFRVWFVDADGHKLPAATNLDSPGVAGYNFEMIVFGWGEPQNALNPTLRAFYTDPIDAHTGMQAFDPSTNVDADSDGVSGPTLVGATQFTTHLSPDRGSVINGAGISTEEPDKDGVCEEITEGDLDLAEFYMLNAVRPGTGRETPGVTAGRQLMQTFGCTSCHVPDWKLEANDPDNPNPHLRFAGDRRVFDLEVAWNEGTERIEGNLVRLHDEDNRPVRGEFTVSGIYTDFKHHDMGPAMFQVAFDGSVQKLWRTAPLWGVGSTAPYAHDGADFTLDSVIRRHGGEAQAATDAYRNGTEQQRRDVVEFLNSLVLYNPDKIPVDINNDDLISAHYMVGGKDVGLETFNAEYLFKTAPAYEGNVVNGSGDTVFSFAMTNIAAAYGTGLEYTQDTDGDGWPDLRDIEPLEPGYLDGWRSIWADLNHDGVQDVADVGAAVDSVLGK